MKDHERSCFSFIACSSSPCLHDGTCILDKSGTYKCACLAGYTGNRCENCEYRHCVYDQPPGLSLMQAINC